MSLRHYTPRRNRRRGVSGGARKILGTSLAIAILLQLAYPLTHGQMLIWVTIFGVYAGATTMVLHAIYSFGWRYAITYVGVTLLFAGVVEQIGVQTGWPFGDHTFDSSLGVRIYSVPLVIPFAWVMLAHPILVAARRVTRNWTFIYGGAVMMAWHLFIDPQLATAHRVRWTVTASHVPFEKDLPLSNPTGWLFAGMLLFAILHLVLPKERRKHGAEFATVDIFLTWTLVAGLVDYLFFFHRPETAVFAGLAYTIILAPYFFSRWLGQPGD